MNSISFQPMISSLISTSDRAIELKDTFSRSASLITCIFLSCLDSLVGIDPYHT